NASARHYPPSLPDALPILNEAERVDMQFAGARDMNRIRRDHPWLEVSEAIAQEQSFFHWELFFGPLFADRGGFDLQVGNPPWVRSEEHTSELQSRCEIVCR